MGDMTITPIERIILPPGDGRPDWLPVAVSGTPAPPPGIDPHAAYIARLKSPQSKRVMNGCLNNLARMIASDALGAEPELDDNPGKAFPWWLLRYQHTSRLTALLDSHQPPYAASYINKHLAALRGILEECWKLELMSGDDYTRARRIEDVKFHREPAGRLIHDDDMARLLAVCSDGIIGIRDTALLATLYCTGIRCEEAATALIEHYDGRERTLRVLGKGNKERTVPIHPAGIPHLETWLALLGDQRGPLFRTVDKHNRIGGAVSPGAIQRRISQRYQQAGIRRLTAHDFRRTFLSEFLDSGADAMQARKVAGHASVATTQLYDLREDRGIREAVSRMKIALPAPPSVDAVSPS